MKAVFLTLALLSIACSEENLSLEEAKALWTQKAIVNYVIEERMSSFSLSPDSVYVVTVVDGVVTDVKNKHSEYHPPLSRLMSIDELFAFIESEDPLFLDATFDPKYGYPSWVSNDDPATIDEELDCEIVRFERP